MDIFSAPGILLNFTLGTLVPFFFVLMLVVFVHELGHYLVGRWCGIHAVAFAVGFGPELLGYTDRRGTRWKLCAIPLGGYVRYLGDLNVASQPAGQEALARMTPEQRRRSFPAASLWKRALAVAAGPAFNFIFAIGIFTGVFMLYGQERIDPVVTQVSEGSAAEAAGFEVGDRLLFADSTPIEAFSDLQRYVQPRGEREIVFRVERDGREIKLPATPDRIEREDRFGNRLTLGVLGIRADRNEQTVVTERFGPIGALGLAVKETGFVVSRTGSYLWDEVIGRGETDQIGGPIRIAQVSGQVATLGIAALVNLAALLSISIGLINLLPVPILDGGHLLFYAFEALLGRPLSPATQEIGFKVGLFLILSLMVFATWNDISLLLG